MLAMKFQKHVYLEEEVFIKLYKTGTAQYFYLLYYKFQVALSYSGFS